MFNPCSDNRFVKGDDTIDKQSNLLNIPGYPIAGYDLKGDVKMGLDWNVGL
jgi:hypothetical protein